MSLQRRVNPGPALRLRVSCGTQSADLALPGPQESCITQENLFLHGANRGLIHCRLLHPRKSNLRAGLQRTEPSFFYALS